MSRFGDLAEHFWRFSPYPRLNFSWKNVPATPSLSSNAPLPPWKRALDLFCCVAALPMLAFCSLGVAIMMRVASPGPILFWQERVGYKGRRFKLYKFRTMHVGSEVSTHQAHFAQLMKSKEPMKKLDARGDKRLIPGGWLLRASGLDELPQILNILRGEMSMVGPRPCIPYEYDNYTPAQQLRCGSVPGLTGLWQVSGKNRTTFDEMIRLDIEYAGRKSLLLDVKIMVLTPFVLVGQVLESRKARRAVAITPSNEDTAIRRDASPTLQT